MIDCGWGSTVRDQPASITQTLASWNPQAGTLTTRWVGVLQTHVMGFATVYQPPALSILNNPPFFTPVLSYAFTVMVSSVLL